MSAPLGCLQLPPLDLNDKEAVPLPGQTLFKEPSSPLSVHYSVLLEPPFTTSCPFPSIISNVSRISSLLEVTLSTRASMWLSTDNSHVPTKATMEGMVQYLLSNPVGELCSSHPHPCELIYQLMLIITDAEQYNTFFMGHIAYFQNMISVGMTVHWTVNRES